MELTDNLIGSMVWLIAGVIAVLEFGRRLLNEHGKVTVSDLGSFLLIFALGPISLLVAFCVLLENVNETYGDHVILERKKEKDVIKEMEKKLAEMEEMLKEATR